MMVSEKLVLSGKASPELTAAYFEVVAMREAYINDKELPEFVPAFVKSHKKKHKAGTDKRKGPEIQDSEN